MHAIRNALEHTYLRVSEGWAKPFTISGTSNNSFGIAIGSDELEAKAIRVMQMARSALFYVSFAIRVEERKKQHANPDQLIVSMPLYYLDASGSGAIHLRLESGIAASNRCQDDLLLRPLLQLRAGGEHFCEQP